MIDPLKTVLTYDHMIATGVADNPLPIMRFEAFRRLMPPFTQLSPHDRRIYTNLCTAASRARRSMTAEQASYWVHRQLLRSMGQDPGSPSPPRRRAAAALQSDAAERRERLLQLDLSPANRPSNHRRGDRSPAAQAERDALWVDWHEAQQLQRQRRRDEAHVQRQLQQRPGVEAYHGRWMRPDVAGARGGARYGLSWTARACADIATIAALGRPLPIARRHPAERVPLTQRVHHRSGD